MEGDTSRNRRVDYEEPSWVGRKREGERGGLFTHRRRVEAATLKVFPNMSDIARAFRATSRLKSKIEVGPQGS